MGHAALIAPTRRFPFGLAAAALTLLVATPGRALVEPTFSTGGPDAASYGMAENYPIGTIATLGQARNLVGSHSHFDQIFPARKVTRPAAASPLRRARAPMAFAYEHEADRRSIADYLARQPATGLLIIKGDTILAEHYQYGRTDRDRFTSQSMAKTIVAMLIGIAVAERKIRSIDEPADAYVPELQGTEYGRTPLRALLHMSSGVAFSEDYGGRDDNARLGRGLRLAGEPVSAAAVVGQFNERIAKPDTKFRYASSETEVLSLVLGRAVGRPVADYLGEKVWRPIGAEADATWVIDRFGTEMGYCCFNAVLRDYARLGRLLAQDGNWQGRQIIPRQWVIEATTVAAPHLAPGTATRYFGYGYQTWLLPGERRMFSLRGIRGQVMFVDPASKLVMVQTAVRKQPTGDPMDAETIALWRALVAQHGGA